MTSYTKNDFETAVKMIISARVRKVKLTVYSVAKQFNIPRSTLTKHIKKNYNQYVSDMDQALLMMLRPGEEQTNRNLEDLVLAPSDDEDVEDLTPALVDSDDESEDEDDESGEDVNEARRGRNPLQQLADEMEHGENQIEPEQMLDEAEDVEHEANVVNGNGNVGVELVCSSPGLSIISRA